MKIARVLLPII